MKMSELYLGELEREAPASRRVLERVPDGRYDWKPHEKSMQLGYLAALVATMPGWIDAMVNQDELDIAPKDPSGCNQDSSPCSAFRWRRWASPVSSMERRMSQGLVTEVAS